MPMSLAEWDHAVGYHLGQITSHAGHLVAHVSSMTITPQWETQAEDELAKAESALVGALGQVRLARKTYQGKPHDAEIGS